MRYILRTVLSLVFAIAINVPVISQEAKSASGCDLIKDNEINKSFRQNILKKKPAPTVAENFGCEWYLSTTSYPEITLLIVETHPNEYYSSADFFKSAVISAQKQWEVKTTVSVEGICDIFELVRIPETGFNMMCLHGRKIIDLVIIGEISVENLDAAEILLNLAKLRIGHRQ